MNLCIFTAMNYNKRCLYCKQPFVAKRKDKIYDTQHCKVSHWNLLRGFKLVSEMMPEKEIKEKHIDTPTSTVCTVYIHWYKLDGKRFGDVYFSDNCDTEMIQKHFAKHNVKQTVRTIK